MLSRAVPSPNLAPSSDESRQFKDLSPPAGGGMLYVLACHRCCSTPLFLAKYHEDPLPLKQKPPSISRLNTMQIPCHSPTSSSSRRTVHFAQADSIFPLSSGNEAASLPNATPPSTSSTLPAQLPLPTPVNIIEPPFSQLEAWMLDSPFCHSIDLGPLEFSSSHLPWIFKVYPRSGAQVITLGDVLKALYGSLRQPATSQEIEDFCHNFGNAVREALFKSREHRAKLGEEQPLVIRRVDFLTGHRWLVGFSASASTKNHWHFHTMERAV